MLLFEICARVREQSLFSELVCARMDVDVARVALAMEKATRFAHAGAEADGVGCDSSRGCRCSRPLMLGESEAPLGSPARRIAKSERALREARANTSIGAVDTCAGVGREGGREECSGQSRRRTSLNADALFLFPPRRSEAVKGMADDISECSEKASWFPFWDGFFARRLLLTGRGDDTVCSSRAG